MKKGQVLIEVIMAFAIAVVALLGLIQLSTKSVSSSGTAKRESQATAYAQQAMEELRAGKANWDEFCSDTSVSVSLDIFTITTAKNCDNSKKFVSVTVAVTWDENNKTKTITQQTQISRY